MREGERFYTMKDFWSWLFFGVVPWSPSNVQRDYDDAEGIIFGGLSSESTHRFGAELENAAETRMNMLDIRPTLNSWELVAYFMGRVMVRFVEDQVIAAIVAKVDELVAVFNDAVPEPTFHVQHDRTGLKAAVSRLRAIGTQAKAAFRKYAGKESERSVPCAADEDLCEAIRERFKAMGHRGIVDQLPPWDNKWRPDLLRWGLILAAGNNLRKFVGGYLERAEALNLPSSRDVDFNYETEDQRTTQFAQFRHLVNVFNLLCDFLKALEGTLPAFTALRDPTCLALFQGEPHSPLVEARNTDKKKPSPTSVASELVSLL